MAACPCGGENYKRCCGRLHRGAARAETALELMKSRYSAYAKGEWEYLTRTHHPSKRGDRPGGDGGLRWTGLQIVDVVDGGPDDDAGVVEFVARYETKDGGDEMRERSLFVREGGAWFYLEGQ